MIILTEFSEPSPSWIWRGGSAASRRRKSVSLGGPLRQRATTDLLRFPSLWHLCLLDGGERRWETVVNLLKAIKPECLPLHLRPFVQESFGGWGRVARFSSLRNYTSDHLPVVGACLSWKTILLWVVWGWTRKTTKASPVTVDSMSCYYGFIFQVMAVVGGEKPFFAPGESSARCLFFN